MTTSGQAAGAAQEAAGQTASTARDEAAATAQVATSAAGDVAGTAKEQVGQVAGEAVDQVRQLSEQARSQANEQATNATQKLSETVRSLAGEVRDMSQGQPPGSGPVVGLAQQLADKGEQLAEYLSQQGPGGLVQEMRGFASRRPGTFLLGALAAGVVTGRLVKGVTASSGAGPSATGGPSAGTATGGPDVVAVVEPLPVSEAELAFERPVTDEPYPAVGAMTDEPVDPLASDPADVAPVRGVDGGYSPPSYGGTGLR